MEDINYLYKPGMNTKQMALLKDKGKYANAPHIGKIIPQKRILV